MITDHQAKYYAHCLTREGGEGPERIHHSLFSASVDLNPHQIEAALFALLSPFTKGYFFADEVGFGQPKLVFAIIENHNSRGAGNLPPFKEVFGS